MNRAAGRLRRDVEVFRHTTPVFQLVFFIIAGLLIAGIALGVFNALLARRVVQAGLRRVALGPGARRAGAVHDAARLRPADDRERDEPPCSSCFSTTTRSWRGFGAIDLVYIWWIVSLSTGSAFSFAGAPDRSRPDSRSSAAIARSSRHQNGGSRSLVAWLLETLPPLRCRGPKIALEARCDYYYQLRRSTRCSQTF
jgi:hypothetical protein